MKKGFTLIELMAVIVVLGVVAVITAPIMGDVIEQNKKGAFEDSVYGLIKAVNLDKAESGFNITRTYTISAGIITPSLETKGSVNGMGNIYLNADGEISLTIEFEKWCASKEFYDNRVSIKVGTCIANSDSSGANVPYLLTNMVPVRYDGTKWVKANRSNPGGSAWYNYDSKMWANAVVVKETGVHTREYYLDDAAIDQEVVESDIMGYFVWIPRYSYAIPTGSGARAINISFESGVPDKAVGTAIGTSYKTHPAFSFGTSELSGIWVSKYEMTGTLGIPTVKPSVAALTRTLPTESLDIFYYTVNNMQLTDNIYGFNPSKMDLHLMKNNEWGAIAYLANSIYGKNAEVWRNPSTTYITGCGGTTAGAVGTTGCSYAYTSANGMQTSTTGNMYGVYDMAGGGLDVVMGNYNDTLAASGLFTMPNAKYYNKFTSTTSASACNGAICYGQAMSETNSWYTGYATTANATTPWLTRGSASYYGGRGIFSYGDPTYNNLTGGSQAGMVFHLALLNE